VGAREVVSVLLISRSVTQSERDVGAANAHVLNRLAAGGHVEVDVKLGLMACDRATQQKLGVVVAVAVVTVRVYLGGCMGGEGGWVGVGGILTPRSVLSKSVSLRGALSTISWVLDMAATGGGVRLRVAWGDRGVCFTV